MKSQVMDTETKLQILWIFLTFNYVYGDVVTLFDKSIATNLDQISLLGASVLVETVIAMVLLSRVLEYRANRLASITVAAINFVATFASLLVAVPSAHYAFFAVIDIVTEVVIIRYAWKWHSPRIQMAGPTG